MTSFGNGHLFQIHASEQIALRLRQLKVAAGKKGKGATFMSALRAIHDRLQKDPTHVGKRLYALPAMQLVVYETTIHPLIVLYVIHDYKPLVFIKDVALAEDF